MDFTISRRLSSGRLYAYYKKRFWFWDDTRNVWTESHLMSQKYEREHSARAALTPEDFMSDLTRFSPLDEYELDSVMVDALKNAIPCKTVPIEPVKEESECPVSIPETSPQSSESAPSEASANVSSVLTSAPPMNCTPDVSIGIPSGMNPPDKPLTFIPENKTPEFDYSGLDKQTVEDLHFAEDEYRHGKKLAERGLVHMGNAIAAAHDALCDTVVQQLDNGQFAKKEDTFRAWCCSIGITKSTAYNLLQVSALMDGSSPRQRAILEALPPTLLYAVAKPSAPPELVEKVKSGDITTNKQYQEALAQIKAEKDRAAAAEAREEEAWNMVSKAQDEAQTAKNDLDAALADVQGLDKENARLKAEKEKAERSYNEMYESRIAANLQRQKAEAERDRAEARAKDAENQLVGSRQMAEAAKLRGDKLKAENDALKKQPITAVVDKEEVERQAREMAAEMTADLRAQLEQASSGSEQDAHSSYDNVLLADRSLQNIGKMVVPSLRRLPPEQREQLTNMLIHTLGQIQGEVSRCL